MGKRLAALLCSIALALCACSAPGAQQPEPQPQPQEAAKQEPDKIEPKKLNDYTWDELSRISAEISAAPDDEEGRSVAQHYGLVDENGALSQDTKQIVLNDTRALDVRLAGIRHDDRADDNGKAGLTFMTVGAWDKRPMNEGGGIEGGWEKSDLRSWLATDAKAMLDDDLAKALIPVNKLTNNVGLTSSEDSVTNTADELWVFSPCEVCGEIRWDVEEYKQKRGLQDVDGLLGLEGSQYEVFEQAGVSDSSDPNGFLSLEQSTGTMPWWYRSPYPFDWEGMGDTGSKGYFYQVRDSGYPESIGSPEVPAGVVVGFCV
ncbi:MAG: DUF6273 domain-containing protein [Coriobacteriales bacterium]|nr:DUF6273 domain-containing protein [Coriobacteriales bacterium]